MVSTKSGYCPHTQCGYGRELSIPCAPLLPGGGDGDDSDGGTSVRARIFYLLMLPPAATVADIVCSQDAINVVAKVRSLIVVLECVLLC